jgi:pimeloyl-ACP methyl ester carboxylesterase
MKINPALLAPGSLGDLPLVVLTAMQKERPEDFPQDLNDIFNQIWLDLQEELASMSTNSGHILAEESGHFIQHDQPELVVEAIKGIFQELR